MEKRVNDGLLRLPNRESSKVQRTVVLVVGPIPLKLNPFPEHIFLAMERTIKESSNTTAFLIKVSKPWKIMKILTTKARNNRKIILFKFLLIHFILKTNR
jgi:hypothetical protein